MRQVLESELEEELASFREEDVISRLCTADRPLWEAELIRLGWPESPAGRRLYARHFALFHRLSHRQREMHQRGLYLHLDCMRVRLAAYPPEGECGHYDGEAGAFCRRATVGDSNRCARHEHTGPEICSAPLAGYYLDVRHFCEDREAVLARYHGMGEPVRLARAYDELGLACDAAWPLVRSRYRRLLVALHPDTGSGDAVRLGRVREAWAVIRRYHDAGGPR